MGVLKCAKWECNNVKNKRWVVLLTAVLVEVAGIVHTAIRYVTIFNDRYTGFPATVSLLILVPYSICSVLCLIVWAILKRKARGNKQ